MSSVMLEADVGSASGVLAIVVLEVLGFTSTVGFAFGSGTKSGETRNAI